MNELMVLATAPGVGAGTHKKLRDNFSIVTDCLNASMSDLLALEIRETSARALLNWRDKTREHDKVEQALLSSNIRLISTEDDEYPELLKTIACPPGFLFLEGATLESKPTVAFVGSRHPSELGVKAVAKLVPPLAGSGVHVASGLAFGIDTAVHETCNAYHIPNIAVIGQGILASRTGREAVLAEAIIKAGGTIMSEFPPTMNGGTFTYPIRNRIISGLSQLVVIVEGAIKSGSLNTAIHAIEQNREVGAVPGPITLNTAEGSLQLLKDGAHLIKCTDDILDILAASTLNLSSSRMLRPTTMSKPTNRNESIEQKLESRLSHDPTWQHLTDGASAEEFAAKSGLDAAKAASWLMRQELNGQIVINDGRITIL